MSIDRRDPNAPPPTVWHPSAMRRGDVGALADADLAFTRNLRRLIDMVKDDGSDLLLVPFRIAHGAENAECVEQSLRNERIMGRLAEEYGVPLAPFPQESITEGNWMDSCHLNAAGNRE